ncbi:hypothetical protein ACTFIW_013067 [Dictyostelium discoideum]
MDKSLLTLGLSAIYNLSVIYESEKHKYSGIEIRTNIIIKPLNGESFWLQVKESELVKDLKEKIRYKTDIPVRFQTLYYGGEKLEDDHLISDHNITYGSTIHMEIGLKGGGGGTNFTSVTDSIVHRSGGEVYTRPLGWMRFALKINKYNTETDGKTWLGQCNGLNEWLVSYHGTNDNSCIYSTPSIDIAKTYGKTFKKKGECQYIIVLQNRVDPKTVIKLDNKYWISPNDTDIRPYGVCIKKVK